MRYLMWYLLAVNIIAFLLYGLDKQKARMHRWRIPEAVLLWTAVLGGSAGSYGAMKVFRHKTKKPKFYIGVPAIFIIQVSAAVCYLVGK